MISYAKPTDAPATWKVKKCVFYAEGLKIYGQIPYRLQFLLDAKFISSTFSGMGSIFSVPTLEPNFTLIPYRQKNGEPHLQSAIDELLQWLLEGKGYEWGVAEDFNREFYSINMMERTSNTWAPPDSQKFHKMLGG